MVDPTLTIELGRRGTVNTRCAGEADTPYASAIQGYNHGQGGKSSSMGELPTV